MTDQTKALALPGQNYDNTEKVARAMVASGYFQDTRQVAQAVVKIMAGAEMGFGPFASMTGINIINGRPAPNAGLMAAAIKRSGRYNYKIITMTDEVCELAFFEGGQETGRSIFTSADAKRAGTKNMDKFPRNMLFSRALSNGQRWYCPDVFGVGAVYTPEEMGAEVNEDGDFINAASYEPPAQQHPADDVPTVQVQQPAPVMPFEVQSWAAFTDSRGEKFGDKSTGGLVVYARNLKAKIETDRAAGVDAETISQLEMKLIAAEGVLAWRKANGL